MLLYMPTYAIRELHLPQYLSYTAAVCGRCAADSSGRTVRRHLGRQGGPAPHHAGRCGPVLPHRLSGLRAARGTASLCVLILMVCWIALLKSCYSGALPSYMAKIFPAATRVSGLSLSYNVGGDDLRRFRAVLRAIVGRSHRFEAGAELLHHGDGAASACIAVSMLRRARPISLRPESENSHESCIFLTNSADRKFCNMAMCRIRWRAPDEVLVDVQAAASVNAADWKFRGGEYARHAAGKISANSGARFFRRHRRRAGAGRSQGR